MRAFRSRFARLGKKCQERVFKDKPVVTEFDTLYLLLSQKPLNMFTAQT